VGSRLGAACRASLEDRRINPPPPFPFSLFYDVEDHLADLVENPLADPLDPLDPPAGPHQQLHQRGAHFSVHAVVAHLSHCPFNRKKERKKGRKKERKKAER
jgi:hypothetical protein